MSSQQDQPARPTTITHADQVTEPERLEMEVRVEVASSERMVFFSDAVVAIALTLLALGLPVPGHQAKTSAQVLRSLGNGFVTYLAFVVSFIVISIHWRGHHAVFRYVDRAPRPLLALNGFWLFLIVITPTITKLLSDGIINVARFAIYAGVEALQYLLFGLMIVLIIRNDWVRPGTDLEVLRNWIRRLAPVAIGFAVSIPVIIVLVSVGQNPSWAFSCWFVVPTVLGFVLRAQRSRRQG